MHLQVSYQMGKAPKHEADIFLHISGLLFKHVHWIQTSSSWLLSYHKAWKYTLCLRKHMTNLVTRELLIHTASQNVNTTGKA